ncbi:type I-E CRISPR-associated protein Cse1/CasA [Streptomyces lydicus]|uniref:type I-E CRISPR-associated protein Cse1/CasA n=1 Tax=Streptomyces lydicus TaxID=47763 RepID=UPI0037B02D5F
MICSNVADGAWLPVRAAPGVTGLEALYGPSPTWLQHGLAGGYAQAIRAAHMIDHIDVPYEAAESVILRNLIAMAMRVTGLDTARGTEWKRLRARVLAHGQFDEHQVQAYFAEHQHRMFVSGERPYRQIAALRDQCGEWSAPGKLVYGLPSGNNHVWFDKRDEDTPVPIHVAIWSLEALHGVGAGGGCGRRQLPGRQAWSKTMAGPYRNAVSYFIRGRTLFETLVLNCPSGTPGAPDEDVAPWESDADPDPLNPASAVVTGRVSLLTGRSPHAVLLNVAPNGQTVQGVQMTWAFQGPGVSMPPALDPYVMHEHSTDKAGREVITTARADPARALWRDVDALLAHTRPAPGPRLPDPDKAAGKTKGQQAPRPPAIFAELSSGLSGSATASALRAARVRAVSLASKQANDVLWWSADSPYALFRPEGDATQVPPTVKSAHSEAEDICILLDRAVKQMATAMCAGNRKKAADTHWPANAKRLFWDRAEPTFWQAVAAALEGHPYAPGRFLPVALSAYDEATAAAARSPRGMQAVAQARTILTRRKKTTDKKDESK